MLTKRKWWSYANLNFPSLWRIFFGSRKTRLFCPFCPPASYLYPRKIVFNSPYLSWRFVPRLSLISHRASLAPGKPSPGMCSLTRSACFWKSTSSLNICARPSSYSLRAASAPFPPSLASRQIVLPLYASTLSSVRRTGLNPGRQAVYCFRP
jgi:hypothetical protein